MAIFVLADTHLSQNLDKEMDIFGRRWAGYTDKLLDGWKTTVCEDDTVVIPGDVSWGMTLADALPGLRFLNSLPGRKILGRGNHDFWWNSLTKMYAFLEANGLDTIDFLFNNAFLVENKLIVGARGWFYDEKTAPKGTDFDKIVAREVGRLELSVQAAKKLAGSETADEMLCFLHFPPIFKGQACEELLRAIQRHGIRRCYYGHIHGVYDYPAETFWENITFRMISADYLSFVPHRIGEKIKENHEGNENIEPQGLTFPKNLV